MTDPTSTRSETSPQRPQAHLLRLLEIQAAASPAGAAAVHLARAEREVLEARPQRADDAAVFLLQTVPLVQVLNDLRRLQDGLRGWIQERDDHAFADCHGPERTPHGLALQAGDRWRLDVHPNGYVGFAGFSRRERQPREAKIFGLRHELWPLPGVGDLCTFVGNSLELPSDATWRLRCTVLNGPAMLLATRADRNSWSGVLPDELADVSEVPTGSIADRAAALLRVLEDLCSEQKFY